MKVFSFCLSLFLAATTLVTAQKKNISLEDIWTKNTFGQEYLDALRPLNNGKEYAVMNFDRDTQKLTVDAYSYKTGEKTKTLIDSDDIPDLDRFQTYMFNADESKVLLGTQRESIYRRSSRGIYYVYNLEDNSLIKISDDKIKEPTFSPDGSKIAYSFENNLFIKDLDSEDVTQFTRDGKNNSIINGTTDWVYEEEFGFTRAFEWNKDGTKIAFLKFDESEVPEFTMEYYGKSPEEDLYPYPYTFKYPKAGDKNSDLSLHIYDITSNELKEVDLKKDYEYLPRIKWTNDADILSVQAMNRHQNELDLIFVNAPDNSIQVVLEERDDNYIDIKDDLTFLEDNSFFWTSEKDNWNHIYHHDKNGKLKRQITKGDWEVTRFYGYNPSQKRLYFQSTESGSVNRDIYSIHLNGNRKTKLNAKTGTNNAAFSKNFDYFINTFNDLETPNVFTVNESKKGKQVRLIKDNSKLQEKLEGYTLTKKEISTIRINGNDLNMWMMKPVDFDPNKKYPLFLYQYSGPGSQQVSNSFFSANDYWYQMLTDLGYIVATIDGRGTGFKGADFKKVTQLELGKYEVEDQIDAAKELGKLDYIDEDRIGIWGWSYGGFMSANALFQGADTFKAAIAVAPVTSWRFYDTVYTERYMTTPQENPEGYDRNSPITHVDKLKGNFLLIHGSADDNVHVQNSMQMIEALIQADKDFDWLIYPDSDHGIYGGNTRYHLYNKMTDFIINKL